MKKLCKIIFKPFFIVSIFLFVIRISSFALNVPALTSPVIDMAGILSGSEKSEIENFLYKVNKTSELQVAVLIIKSLENEGLEDYSMRVAESWKLGSKEKDSGALLLVSINEKKIRIETGYGLEGTLTDAVCSKIIRNAIAPHFKQDDYGKGILEGVKFISGAALQDETLLKSLSSQDEKGDFFTITDYFYLVFFVIVYILGLLITRNPFWILILLLRSGRGGSSGGGFSGSGGFSGGGGRFGGGGASGGW
ncbi:TPM domain-containing protein [Treponema pedis]|uniref:TPM domain-containing protein n=1 Tax=Treponema pedis TaxID=409322 RepID=UPI000494D5DE|nr:TPM domain-containing protein [Treponema pedis]